MARHASRFDSDAASGLGGRRRRRARGRRSRLAGLLEKFGSFWHVELAARVADLFAAALLERRGRDRRRGELGVGELSVDDAMEGRELDACVESNAPDAM